MLVDEAFHFFLRPAVYRSAIIDPVFITEFLDQLIRAETLVTFLAIHKRIRESSQMSGCYPCLRIHKDRAVYTDVVRIFLDKLLPPCFFYIVFQFHTEISVIPGIRKSTINVGTRIYKSSCLCQRNNLVHCLFHISNLTFHYLYIIYANPVSALSEPSP